MAIYEFPISDLDIPDLYVKDVPLLSEKPIFLGSHAGEQAADNEGPYYSVFVGVFLTHKDAETLALALLAELENQGYDWREAQDEHRVQE